MKIGTIIFTYHRSTHTQEVLDALSQNSVLPEKLYIFQDGKKESTNKEEWDRVEKIINKVIWCDTEIHTAQENMGLAKSITSGVDYVLENCDAVIVLEDDCVPDKQFMKFMTSALETYQEQKKVYSVSGYAWNIDLPCDGRDAYFNGRISSYGWGTWKDRWSQYEEDYRILERIKTDSEANRRLSVWGNDLETMLVGRLTGKNSSWAVFWALKVIEKGGYCLSASKTLIHNIGLDGSGENNGTMRDLYRKSGERLQDEFCFPVNIESTKECEEEFRFLFGGKHGTEKMVLYRDFLTEWLQMKQSGRKIQIDKVQKEELAVWGEGAILDCLIQEAQVSVRCIIESRPRGEEYKGIPIVSVNEIPAEIKNIIVIPFFDLSIIKHKVKKLRPDIGVWGMDEILHK